VRTLLIISVACAGIGVALIFGYCDGTTSFDFAYPLAATRLHLDITTKGVPALAGLLLSLIGSFLLAAVWVIALLRPFGHLGVPRPPRASA
jgi:hypothetical protein